MTDPRAILEPLIGLDTDALAGWFLRCSLRIGSDPLDATIGNYENPIHLVLDFLPDLKDITTSRRFGDSAFKAFRRLLEDRERASQLAAVEFGDAATELLFAIESLPLSEDVIREGTKYLLLLLTSRSYEFLSCREADLRAAILLAIGAHATTPTLRPELAYVLGDDLTDSNYVVPAFAIAIRIHPTYAASRVADAVRCLQESDLPIRHLMLEIARAAAMWPQHRSMLFDAVASLKIPEAKSEFAAALRRVDQSLVQQYQQAERASLGLVILAVPNNVLSISSKMTTPQRSMGTSYDLDQVITDSVRKNERDPVAIGEEIGDIHAMAFRLYQRLGTRRLPHDAQVVRFGADLVNYLDNGRFSGQETFADGEAIPQSFSTKEGRRLVAAHSVRSFVKNARENDPQPNEFKQEVRISKLPGLLEHALDLLKSPPDRLRMTVTPFPEDRLIYHVLSTAAAILKKSKMEAIRIPWGEPTSVNSDLTMMNEWADHPQVREKGPEHAIFMHRGYYIYISNPVADTLPLEERLQQAFNLGIERYRKGEYPEMFRRIRNTFGGDSWATGTTERAPNWTEDFEQFISGRSRIYLGGSINARLLNRLWAETGRIGVLCDPTQITAATGHVPQNHLVIGSNLLDRTKARRQEFEQAMVRVFREAGSLLNEWAQRARENDEIGNAIIRHFVGFLSPKTPDKPLGIRWNFVVTEEDVIALILEDNQFIVGHQ